jgi:hypothetical protein
LQDDTAIVDFLDWALPEVMFELGKAAAAADAVAEGRRAAAARQGLQFAPARVQLHPAREQQRSTAPGLSHNNSRSRSGSSGSSVTLAGELQLGSTSKLLAGRSVVAVACPPTPADAGAAAAAIGAAAAAAAAVSGHLLLSCCSPVAMSAESALKEHGIAGLGCLCVWDLKAQQQQQQQQQQLVAASSGGGLVQLLVNEGRPSCCCWGSGAGSCLVFAGGSASIQQHFSRATTAFTVDGRQLLCRMPCSLSSSTSFLYFCSSFACYLQVDSCTTAAVFMRLAQSYGLLLQPASFVTLAADVIQSNCCPLQQVRRRGAYAVGTSQSLINFINPSSSSSSYQPDGHRTAQRYL